VRAPKVFGIGFQKTGTSSLDAAFRSLGYRTDRGVFLNTPNKKSSLWIGPPLTNTNVLERVLPITREKEAFSDNPWPLLYRDLDSLFPDSKFVLTVREPQSWLESLVRHFGSEESDMLEWIYGVRSVRGNEQRCLQVYETHNAAVREHFAARPDALLELDVARDARWDELCTFLGNAIPAQPFPRANTAAERERKRSGVWRLLKGAVRRT
jgi:hypothetical protein